MVSLHLLLFCSLLCFSLALLLRARSLSLLSVSGNTPNVRPDIEIINNFCRAFGIEIGCFRR